MTYVTDQEYLSARGEQETIRITDEDRTGTYDSEKLDAALRASEEEVDSYVGRRYTTPLISVPNLIKSNVIALARERLFGTSPTPAVTAEAERARKQLENIAKGIMVLPSQDGPVPEEALAPADSASSHDGPLPIFTEYNMAGFGVPNGRCIPNWRR